MRCEGESGCVDQVGRCTGGIGKADLHNSVNALYNCARLRVASPRSLIEGEMKKNLLVVLTAGFVALATTAGAQGLPGQQFQQSTPLQLQQQQFQLQMQQSAACNSSCSSSFNTCTLNCPAISSAAVPDP